MMKKSLIAIAIVSTLLVACSKKENNSEMPSPHDQTITATTPVADTAAEATTAVAISPEWVGKYEGNLPCADCEAIKTEIELRNDKTFILKETYVGKSGQPFETKGELSFDTQNPTLIVLKTPPDNRQFLIEKNTITALDMDGEKIDGETADLYILKKKAS